MINMKNYQIEINNNKKLVKIMIRFQKINKLIINSIKNKNTNKIFIKQFKFKISKIRQKKIIKIIC